MPQKRRPSETELHSITRRLKNTHLIAKHYGVSRRAVQQWFEHYEMETPNAEAKRIFDAAVEQFDVDLRVRDRLEVERRYRKFSGRIGTIGDLHAPFADKETVEAFLSLGPYDLLIINGDLFDWGMFGRHVRDCIATADETFWTGVNYVRALAESAEQTIVIAGNHDHRLDKMLKRELDIEVLKQIQTQGYTTAIQQLVKEVEKKVVAVEDFRVRIADVFFSHHETGGVTPMSGVVRAAEACWNEHSYEKHPWRMVVHAHAHTEVGMFVHRRIKHMSTGTASVLLPFTQIGKGTRNAWYNAFGVIEMKKGIAQFNHSRVYCVKILGAENDAVGFAL